MAADNVMSAGGDKGSNEHDLNEEHLECRHSEHELEAISHLRQLNAQLAAMKAEIELLEDERSEYLAVLHTIEDEELRNRALSFVNTQENSSLEI